MEALRYCLLIGDENVYCNHENCDYCREILEHHEPSDDEIEAEMERKMAEAEAMADNL